MVYNRHIHAEAPLPSGALPTPEEMAGLRQAAWGRDMRRLQHALGRLFAR